jgi:hypothetical protein
MKSFGMMGLTGILIIIGTTLITYVNHSIIGAGIGFIMWLIAAEIMGRAYDKYYK